MRLKSARKLYLVLALVVVSLLASLTAETGERILVEENVVYGKVGDEELKLDMARPDGDGPFPAVVCIHGGGWRSGDKSEYSQLIRELARQGYVAVTVSYRFAPEHRFPAQVEDVKCAVRYLRANAARLKIEPTRIGALGDSAGGHLALMLGLLDEKDGLEGDGGHAGVSSKVQAVVNYYGPADLGQGGWNLVATKMAADLLGTRDRKQPVVKQASPIQYIDANDPPVLSFHGSADLMVPSAQSKRLHAALEKAKVTHRLEILHGLGHGWRGREKERTNRAAIRFFDLHLKGIERPEEPEKGPPPVYVPPME